jgi:septum site-determining protein MinC
VKQSTKEDLKKKPHGKDTALDIKGSVFTLTVLCLKSADSAAIEQALHEHLSRAPRFFHNAPVVIDVKALRHDVSGDTATTLDFALLTALLRKHNLVPVGVRHAAPEQLNEVITAGLAILQGGSAKPEPAEPPVASATGASATPPPNRMPKHDERSQDAPEPTPRVATTTKIVRQPVRSGQQIYAKDGDLILLAPVNAGAEVLADGNIHIYAPLRGRALAGVTGDMNARIFTHSLEAELVSVAGHYRIFEQQPAADVHGKSVQIYLENERLVITPLI